MDYQDESARHEQSHSESREAASPATPQREAPRRRTPTPFPQSDHAVSQADGEA